MILSLDTNVGDYIDENELYDKLRDEVVAICKGLLAVQQRRCDSEFTKFSAEQLSEIDSMNFEKLPISLGIAHNGEAFVRLG